MIPKRIETENLMRSKAQIMPSGVTSTVDNEQAMIEQFLAALPQPNTPAQPAGPEMVMIMDEGVVGDAAPGSEESEHIGFGELTEAITLLESASQRLKEHEEVEKAEGDNKGKGDKKEAKAIKELEKAIENVKAICADLCEAEGIEHEEKGKEGDEVAVDDLEAVAEKSDSKEEEVVEEKGEKKEAKSKARVATFH